MTAESKTSYIPLLLFVEDEPNMLELFKKVFSEKGYKVITAANGVEGLDQLKHHTPDLIISDIMMPEMDGITFFNEVKKIYKSERPIFIFLTAKREENDVINGLTLGVDDYIPKPVSIRQLVSKVSNLLERIQEQKKSLSSGLRGSLDDQGIADILQFIELSKHTGKLLIRVRGKNGFVNMVEGRVTWSEFPPFYGEEAIYTLFALQEGQFQFEFDDAIDKTQKISLNTYALILEGLKRLDERGREKILEGIFDDAPQPFESLGEKETGKTDSYRLPSQDVDQTTNLPLPIQHYYEPEPASWFKKSVFERLGVVFREVDSDSFSVSWIKEDQITIRVGNSPENIVFLVLGRSNIINSIMTAISSIGSIQSNPQNTVGIATLQTPSFRLMLVGLPIDYSEELFKIDVFHPYPCIAIVEPDECDIVCKALQTMGFPAAILISQDASLIEKKISEASAGFAIPVKVIAAKQWTWLSLMIVLRKIFQTLAETAA